MGTVLDRLERDHRRIWLANAANREKAASRSDFLLLNAVRRDGPGLGQHVLAGVEDAPACAQGRLTIAATSQAKPMRG